MAAASRPGLKTAFEIEPGVFERPVINPRQMRDGDILSPAHASQADVFDFMAGGTKGNESGQFLDVALVIVFKDFVTLDRPLRPPASTDFTNISCAVKNNFPYPVPFLFGDVGPDVAIPGRTGH